MANSSRKKTATTSQKSSSTRARKTQNSSRSTATAPKSMSMRDYKRAMRKQFTEVKKTATSFASVNNLQSMPTQERQAIRQMINSVESAHQKLVKWWGR